MLRVTPIYGSRYIPNGPAEEPSCTLIDFAGCRVLVNVGWWGYNNNNTTTEHEPLSLSSSSTLQEQTVSSIFPNDFPDHDCLLLTDSTIQSIGGLPMYYRIMKEKMQQRILKQQQQQQQQSVKSEMKTDEDSNTNTNATTTQTQIKEDNTTNFILPPIYATFPTVKMGQMTLYDQHACICYDGIKPPYTLEDVDDSCCSIQSIKYSQSMFVPSSSSSSLLSNDSNNSNNKKDTSKNITTVVPLLTITAQRAGHVVGGAFYVLRRIQDETIVVITEATYHVAKEKHLDSSTLLQYGTSPDVLITKPGGPAYHILKALSHPQKVIELNTNDNDNTTINMDTDSELLVANNKKKKIKEFIPIPSILVSQAEKQLVETIMSVLRRDGNVLLPVDTSGRVLELLLLLNNYWSKQKLYTSYNLVWCSNVCYNTIQFAQSQLEWMSNTLGQEFDNNSSSTNSNKSFHPFHLKHVKMCTNIRQMESLLEEIGITNTGSGGTSTSSSAGGPGLSGASSSTNTTGGGVAGAASGSNSAAAGGSGTGGSGGDGTDRGNYNPTVVLASGLSLEGGPARDIFLKWANDPDNAIVFTDSSQCYLRCPPSSSNTNTNTNTTGSASRTIKYQEQQQQKQQQQEGIETVMSTALKYDDYSSITNPITSGLQRSTSLLAYNNTQDDIVVSSSSAISGPVLVGSDDTSGNGIVDNGTATSHIVSGDGGDDGDTVITKPSIWTTSAQLLKAWAKAKATNCEMDDSIRIDIPVPYRTSLGGIELKVFLSNEENKRLQIVAEEERRLMLHEIEVAKGQLRLGNVDDTTDTTTGVGGGTQKQQQLQSQSDTASKGIVSTTTTTARPRKKSRFDSALFLKFSKPLYLTFDIRDESVGIGQPEFITKFGIGESRPGEILEDDYGIAVQPERFTDIVSGVDPTKFGSTGRVGDDVLKRGYGYGVNDPTTGTKKSKANYQKKQPIGGSGGGSGGGKTVSSTLRIVSEDEDQDDDNDDYDETDMEALDLSEGTGIIRGRNGRTPIKVCTVHRQIEVLAEISYIPGLEGRVDARAARQSVRALQPREVIVLGGRSKVEHNDNTTMKNNTDTETETKKEVEDDNDTIPQLQDEVAILANVARSFASGSKVIQTPSNNEVVELVIGHAAYTVRLIDTPYEDPIEKTRIGYEPPIPIEPIETKLGACNVSLLDYAATGQKVAADGSIVLAPKKQDTSTTHTSSSSSIDIDTVSPPVYISDGEVLLTDLRTELIAQGMKAEYSAHSGYSQLIVNGKIVIRKELTDHESGGGAAIGTSSTIGSSSGYGDDSRYNTISVEGPLCEDFYVVRSIVNSQFVVL